MPANIVPSPLLESLRLARPALESADKPAFDPGFMSHLAGINRGDLAQALSERRCVEGEVVFAEGEAGDALYIIRAGGVAVIKGEPSDPAILGYRGLGEIIGEMALVDNAPRSATVVALEPLKLLRISRERFQEVLLGYPFIQQKIMELLSGRLRGSDQERSAQRAAAIQLEQEVSTLQAEKAQLLEVQRVRAETSDFIVHDLRNPLGVLLGTVEMLLMVLPEETLAENRELLEIARSSCDRMQRLVDSLLEVRRMEAGNAGLHLAAISPAELLARTALRVSPVHLGKLTMVTTVEPGLPDVLADCDQIERVLANLLDNATKHTPTGGQVTLAAARSGSLVALSVSDSGPGIPPEERTRIFERFAQVAGEQRRRRGFGLGLTFCKLAVEAHGGQIWVEPAASGQGSTFILTLPAA